MTTITTVTGQRIQLKRAKPGPKPLPPEYKKRDVHIALRPFWHERGKALAAEKSMSFSAFIEDLIVYAVSLDNETA